MHGSSTTGGRLDAHTQHMCTAFIMHAHFPITHACYLGTRLGWYMRKSDRCLKRTCAGAGFIITTAENPANSRPFRLEWADICTAMSCQMHPRHPSRWRAQLWNNTTQKKDLCVPEGPPATAAAPAHQKQHQHESIITSHD